MAVFLSNTADKAVQKRNLFIYLKKKIPYAGVIQRQKGNTERFLLKM